MDNDQNDPFDVAAMLGAKRAHQDDQLESGMRDTAGVLHMYYRAYAAAGFTDAQAFALTLQFHRLFTSKCLGLRD